jgi:cellulose 1,4-beta-cellobiosidase
VISGTPTATVNASALAFKVTDSTTPTAQTDITSLTITIVSGAGHSVLLSWDASLSYATSGYNVYRSNISGSSYAKINSAPVPGLSYTDATVASGQTYYYVTTAVDSIGDESGFSNEIQEVVP